MKYIINLFTVLCFLFLSSSSMAQPNVKKPALFSNYPKIVYCNTDDIANLFSIATGQNAHLKFDANLTLEGPVINKISKYNNTLQTLAIQIPAFGNSILSISKRKEKDNSEVFIGHLYNGDYADGYELKPGSNNQYQLVKIAFAQVLQPCTQ